jgi:flagellin
MTSILTNNAAMAALQTLRSLDDSMEETQARVSSGLRVGTASDNAAYWSIATTMRSDNGALSAVQDALGLGAAKVDTAYAAMESAVDVVTEIKNKLVAARETGVDRSKIQAEITQYQAQLQGTAESASFSGENWLAVDSSSAGYNATKTIVSSFTRAGASVSIGTISIDVGASKLFDSANQSGILDTQSTTTNGGVSYSVVTLNVATLTDSDNDLADLEQIIQSVDAAIAAMTTSASNLGAAKKRIDLQQDFVSSLMDAVDRGVGQLVDADMNEESAKLSALQVQQQLGIQALSIANSNSQNILSLFK